jgi:hypothetical protein
MSETDKIPLALLAREIGRLTGAQPPKNRKLWMLIVDGTLPAEQTNGRWTVLRSDLPAIVEILRQAETAPRRIRTPVAA